MPARPSSNFVYALALAAILFSQPTVSQTQPPSQSNTASSSAAANNTKPNSGKVNCTNNGTYVNSKGQTVPRPENMVASPSGSDSVAKD
jgi:hypothetical protein